jgi:hypothetical protein
LPEAEQNMLIPGNFFEFLNSPFWKAVIRTNSKETHKVVIIQLIKQL